MSIVRHRHVDPARLGEGILEISIPKKPQTRPRRIRGGATQDSTAPTVR